MENEPVTQEKLLEALNEALKDVELKNSKLSEKINNRITIERDALRELISQVQRIEPRAILADIQNMKDSIFNIRDKLNDLELWKAEKLEKDVKKYNINHTPEEMKELYKKSNVTLKEVAEKFFIDKSVISRVINNQEGNALLRHKVYLYMLQVAHKNIQGLENDLLVNEAV